MRFATLLIALLFAASVSVPLMAQGRGKGQAHKPTAGQHGGAKPDHAGPKPPKTKPTTVAGDTTRAPKAPKTDARVKGNPHKTAPVVTDVTPNTPVTRVVKNPRLETKLLSMLPQGTNIQDASQGFKNWGQFVAAVHVSNNLGVPFDSLKAAMTGIPAGSAPGTVPTTTPMSLGQAIQTLRPDGTAADGDTLTQTKIKNEVKKAEDAASADLRRTSGGN